MSMTMVYFKNDVNGVTNVLMYLEKKDGTYVVENQ